MPELPEVETIKLQLNKYISEATLLSVKILNPKYEIPDKSKILNRKVVNIRRFAKILSIDFDNDFSILIHVKLTGQLIYRGERLKINNLSKKVIGGIGGKHTHIIFHFNDGDLFYNDVRQFGWVRLVKSSEMKITSGPEPFADLTWEYFKNLLDKSKRNIKVLLMDQTKIGGIGNIYANDALWLSEISPKRISNTLSDIEKDALYDAIENVLKAGLKYGGASELAFVTPDGLEGQYQDHTLVYGRQGKACSRCGKILEKFFLGGRGTYWCKICQV